MVRSITEVLAAGGSAGVLATAAKAETPHEQVPDFSSNLAGWVANEQDFVAVSADLSGSPISPIPTLSDGQG
jgi:hypothetical protein